MAANECEYSLTKRKEPWFDPGLFRYCKIHFCQGLFALIRDHSRSFALQHCHTSLHKIRQLCACQ